MVDEREPLVRLTQASGGGRGKRPHAAAAHFVEHDEDASADDALIDPLDDRDSRCALRGPVRPA